MFRLIVLVFKLIFQLFFLLIKLFLGLLLFFFVIGIIISIFNDKSLDFIQNDKNTTPFSENDYEKIDSFFKNLDEFDYKTEKDENLSNADKKVKYIQECNSSLPVSKYTRTFTSLNSQLEYTIDLEVKQGIACEASYHRNNLNEPYYNDYLWKDYWGKVYKMLVDNDTKLLEPIFEALLSYKEEKQMDEQEFAYFIVNFVQNIRYTLVISGTKEEAISNGGYAAQYIQNNEGPFLEKIRFGLQSPAEFLYNLKGDCDTRTVLLYTILSHFGYDVVIINNSEHSMLGIHMPAQGEAIRYRGKKYYFWETTNTGWMPGQIPPNYSQRNDWYIALPPLHTSEM